MTSAEEIKELTDYLGKANAYWLKLYEGNLVLAQELFEKNISLDRANEDVTELRRRVNELEADLR